MVVTEIQRGEATPRLDWKLTSFQYNTQAGALLGLEQIIKQVLVAQLCLTLCNPIALVGGGRAYGLPLLGQEAPPAPAPFCSRGVSQTRPQAPSLWVPALPAPLYYTGLGNVKGILP